MTEAVEAATQALRNAFDNGVDGFRDQARAALEAAAPHLASAWHDAVSDAYVEGALSADAAGVMYNKNPHHSAGARK